MSTIYNISAGFLQICENYLGKKELSPEDIFKQLSYEMGGDGKKITRKELDDYINKADKGLIKVDRNRLNALKRIQQNWDDISQGKDNITFADMKGHESLLLATVVGTFTETEIKDEDKSNLIEEIYDLLKKSLGIEEDSKVKKEDLVEYLNNILSETPDEDANSEIIGTLVNMISAYDNETTVEIEA